MRRTFALLLLVCCAFAARADPSAAQESRPQQPPKAGRIGPSFNCEGVTQPLPQMICASPELSRLDLRFVQAFQALLYQVGKAGRSKLWEEAINFQKSVLKECGIPEAGPVSGSPDCVAAAYKQQRAWWLSRLKGAAREEATRPIREHVALQAKLQQLGFLPAAAKIDGVYGPATRAAILAWQGANGRPETGFLSDADAAALEGAAPRVASKTEASPPAPAATAPVVKPLSAPSVASAVVPEVKGAPQSVTWPCSKSEFASLIQKAILTGHRLTIKGTEHRYLSQGNTLNGWWFDVFPGYPDKWLSGGQQLADPYLEGRREIVSRDGRHLDRWEWDAGFDGRVFQIKHSHYDVRAQGSGVTSTSYTKTFLTRNPGGGDPEGLSRWHRFLAQWCGAAAAAPVAPKKER